MGSEQDYVQVERRGSAVWLWLNRPEVRNALNDQLQKELLEQLQRAENNKSVRTIVFAGRGQAFCAGGDLSRMEQVAKQAAAKSLKAAKQAAAMFYRIATYPKPIIARVHGAAFAGGMGLVGACDLVVAAEEAEFCLPEVKIGMVPATISPYIVRWVGPTVARRLVLTGDRIGAREAERLGLLHACVPAAALDARVEELSAQLAQCGPEALARSKKLLMRVVGSPLTPQLGAYTAGVLSSVRAGPEAREGIRAFLEKRKPAWRQ